MTSRIRPTFGQALHANRPHLVGRGFLTPNITATEYAQRRARIFAEMPPNSLAIVGGNRVQHASPSMFYPFRQDPNFQYLTGFLEPDSCLVLHKSHQANTELLFVPEKDEFAEQWEGDRTGTAQAKQTFGIDAVLPNSTLRDTLKALVGAVSVVYADTDPATTVRQGSLFNHELPALVSAKLDPNGKTASNLVQALREIKSEAEIDCLRTAGEISAAAYNMAYKQQFVSEHQLHAYLEFMFRQSGCESEAYVAVVAGGDHALTIHYVRNDDLLRDGDLVLVDAAGRYGGYCADISRTWPVNGRFSPAQRDLYEAVLATEKECIDQCTTESAMSLHDLHRYSETSMLKNLQNAGLQLTRTQLNMVYPHMIGHQLGLDVHDIALRFSNQKPLRANQVVTVEPGVYIPYDDQFPKHFQGIGIRIEDNVVVGNACEVLTADCGKEVDEVER